MKCQESYALWELDGRVMRCGRRVSERRGRGPGKPFRVALLGLQLTHPARRLDAARFTAYA